MSIRRLSPEIASKIAAGEVIERPASVVKELVENAIDAGARRVTVEVSEGGLSLIQVTDDGHGIAPDQLELAVQRHSTSKLRTVDDLARIRTLGFRGEALASIAAMAELTIASVTDAGTPGHRVTARDDAIVDSTPHAGPVGTQVTVRALFRSIPARRQFLKAERTELGHVMDAVTHAAIGHPSVAFRLLDGERERLRTPGTGDLRATLVAVHGQAVVTELIKLPPGETLGIDGFVSQPHVQRSNRRDISLFVNGRWVGDRLLAGAISDAYQGLLPSRRYPVVVLRLEIPPEDVDVNVHPAKAEVRFRRGGEVFSRVSATVRRALTAGGAVTPARVDEPILDQFYLPTSAMPWDGQSPPAPQSLPGEPAAPAPPESEPNGGGQLRSPVPRALGQIDQMYIVAVGPSGIYLIDQHAAHERILYNQLGESGNGASQALLDPAPVTLSAAASEWVGDHLPDLAALGVEVEPFGANAWLVRRVPATGRPIDAAAYLSAVVDETREAPTGRRVVTEQLRWTAACHAAVKAGDQLTLDEMQAVVEGLERCDLGLTCPHGRPTMILLTRDLLDRQFGRG
ncbi:MAG: DNA mismatch repair endonuclease MutL [Chloroflexota bacterium]|nr:DNA mismatch repair endonuclease MutL [Chloroflexota bacterium]